MNNERLIARLFPNASTSFLRANSGLPDTKLEQNETKALAIPKKGTDAGVRRVVVRFTLCRLSLLDRDSAYASVKDVLDGLRHAALIPDDTEAAIVLEVEQEPVANPSEQCTKLKLIY
jgi:hypothetical protein